MRLWKVVIPGLVGICFYGVTAIYAGDDKTHSGDDKGIIDTLLSAIDSVTMTPVEKAIRYVQQENSPKPADIRNSSLAGLADLLKKAQKSGGVPKGCRITKLEYHEGDFELGERLFISVDDGVNPPVSIKLGARPKAFLPNGYASYPEAKEKRYDLYFGDKSEPVSLSEEDLKQVTKASEKIRAGASFCYLRTADAEVGPTTTTQGIECRVPADLKNAALKENDAGPDTFYIEIAQNNQNRFDIKISHLTIKKTKFMKLPAGNMSEATIEKAICGIPNAVLEVIGTKLDASGANDKDQKNPAKKPTKSR